MNKEMVMDIVRTTMKVVGTWVMATGAAHAGGLTQAGWDSITGGMLVAVSFLWSLWSTYGLTK